MLRATVLRDLLTPGYRPLEVPCAKLPGSVRIVVAGDSYAYGHGTREDESLPRQLEAELDRMPGLPFCEVLNLGHPGFNIYKELEALRRIGRRLDFDILVLCLSSDDASALPRRVLERGGEGDRERWRVQWHPDGVDFPLFLRALGTLTEDQARAGRRVLVTFYEPVTGAADLPLAVLPPICHELAVPFVDLYTPFTRFATRDLVVSEVDSHPSALAHRIAAVELSGEVRRLVASVHGAVIEKSAESARRMIDWVCEWDEAVGGAGRSVGRLLDRVLDWPGGEVFDRAATGLRRAVSRFLTGSLLRELLVDARPEIDELGETLSALRTSLLVDALACDGSGPAPSVDEELGALDRSMAAMGRALEAVDRRLAAAEASRSGPVAADGAGGATEPIERLARRLVDRSEPLDRANRSALRGLEALLGEIEALPAGRGSRKPHPEVGRVARALDRLALALGRSGEAVRGRAELSVSVALSTEPGVEHADLVVDWTVLAPYVGSHRQVHYLVRDRLDHPYRFDPPPGIVATARLRIRRYLEAGSVVAADRSPEIREVRWMGEVVPVGAARVGPLLVPPASELREAAVERDEVAFRGGFGR